MKRKNTYLALMFLFSAAAVHAQVTGSGTPGAVPVWTTKKNIGNSAIASVSGNVGIGTTTPGAKLDVESSSTTQPTVTGNNTATTGTTTGVFGGSASPNGVGVFGNMAAASGGTGVLGYANSATGIGVFGINASASGYSMGAFNNSTGYGVSMAGPSFLIVGYKGTSGLFSVDTSGTGNFAGNLNVAGTLTKGAGSFKIDHPLDPENKYLSHSFVESPDMMNIYNGVVVLDAKGQAAVTLPEYFQALNSDFRYQLTAIGAPGPNLYIAQEISENHFKIAGGKPGAKVSWQVTGIRQDAYAQAHRIRVEEDKPAQERGHYLHPELFGATEKDAVGSIAPPAVPLPAAAVEVNAGNVR